MSGLIALVGVLTVLCLGLGIYGYLSDKWLERQRTLPPPTKRSIAGESYRPWM